MSRRAYFMKSSRKKEELKASGGDEPVVNRFSEIQAVDTRRHEVLDYMMLGFMPEEIAEYMDESVATVRGDMDVILKLGYEARDEELSVIRDELMRGYRMVKKEAFRAFKLSQGEKKKKTHEEGESEKGFMSRRKTVSWEDSGDPRFLSAMIDASKEMGKVSGAQKHKEVEIQQNVNQNSLAILSPNRTRMPADFDRWTKKPDGEQVPEATDGEDQV